MESRHAVEQLTGREYKMVAQLEAVKESESEEKQPLPVKNQESWRSLDERILSLAAQFETIKHEVAMVPRHMKNEINDHINMKVTDVAHEVFRSSVSDTERQLKPVMEEILLLKSRINYFHRLLVKNEFHELMEELLDLQAKFKKKAVLLVKRHALEGKRNKGEKNAGERTEPEGSVTERQ